MKIIFLQDVLPTARAGDVKEVKNGFARNFLLPRNLATLATKRAIDQAESLREHAKERRIREIADSKVLAEHLSENGILIVARAGASGKLYGSVTQAMVARAVSTELGRNIPRRNITIEKPIRSTGKFSVEVRLSEYITTNTTVTVKSDIEQSMQATEPQSIVENQEQNHTNT